MIDELMDSMVLDKLPSMESLEATLTDLCRGAEDQEPILHSFKNSQHLRVGVRDILSKESLRSTHCCLSNLAEVCLQEITKQQLQRLVRKFGQPTIVSGPHRGEPASLVILAMGKLGGQEPNYHSDLDVVFLYEAEGNTVATEPGKPVSATTNQHFFSELGQRIIRVVNQLGPYGRLYELDPRLRPTGKNGPLAVSLEGFERYFKDRSTVGTSGTLQSTDDLRLSSGSAGRPIGGSKNHSRQTVEKQTGGGNPTNAGTSRTNRFRP